MRWLIDLVYLIAALVGSPVWLPRMIKTGKIRTDWRGRFGLAVPIPAGRGKRILFHAVSVGR